jgi:hypothetical protein
MGVYELSGAGSVKTGRTLYTSMNANNQYGALVPIGYQVTPSPASSLASFYNIPANYQDLMLVISGRTTATGSAFGTLNISYNNTSFSSSTMSGTILSGNGSSATSSRFINYGSADAGYVPNSTATSGVFSSTTLHILNYANTTTNKTILSRSSSDLNGSGITSLIANLWPFTSAINSIQIFAPGNYATGSTFTLYGIRAVSS